MASVVTNRGSIWNTTAGNKTVTATPAVGDLIVVIAASSGLSGGTTAVSDDQGGTYTQVDSDRTGFSTTGVLTAWVRNSAIASAVSTVFTASQAGSSGGGLIVFSCTNIGVFGASAVRSSGGQSSGTSGTTPAPVLSKTPNSLNPIIMAMADGTNGSANNAVRSGYTEDTDAGYNTPATGWEVQHIASGETSATLTFGATAPSAFASIALEIAFNSSPTVALNSPADTATGQLLTPDLSFTGTDADGDAVTYEIQVDTSNTFGVNTTNLSPTQDTFYGTSFSTGPNGSATGLHIGGFGDNYYTFLQFDLSSIPVGATITSATLSLTIVGSNTSSPMPVVRRMTHSWVDSTLTLSLGGSELSPPPNYWSTSNTDGTFATFTITIGDVNTVDITALVQGWYNGTITNNGCVVVPTQFNSTNHDIQVGSVESTSSSDRPKLTVNYTVPPVIDKLSASDVGFTDVTNGAHTDPFVSGDQVKYTVQSALSASTTYYWRVRGKDPSGSAAFGAWATTRSFTTGTGGNNYTQSLPETITMTDSLVKQGTKLLKETATMTDAIIKSTIRKLTETITMTDVLTPLHILLGNFTETFTVTDTLTRQTTKLATEVITMTDALAKKTSRLFSETLTMTDTVLKQLARTLTESITMSDVLSSFISHFKTLTENITITDTLTKLTSRLFTEATTITDTLLKQGQKLLTEAITVSDTLTKQSVKALSEVITLTDALAKRSARLIAESFTVADTLLKQATKTLTEAFTATDTFAGNKITLKLLTETITITDSLTKVAGRLLTEAITMTDTLAKQTARLFAETFTATDSFVKQTTRKLTENITMSDTLTKIAGVLLAETISISDVLAKQTSRLLTEAATITDTLKKQTTRLLTETFTVADTLVKFIGKLMTESITVTDTLSKQFARVFSETVSLLDTLTKQSARLLTEAFDVADTMVKSLSRIFSETITVIDLTVDGTTGGIIHKFLNETITVTDSLSHQAGKLFTETIAFTDSLTKSIGKLMLESLTVRDTLNKRISRLFTEQITMTDVVYRYFVPAFKAITLSLLYPISAIIKLGKTAFTLKKDSTSAVLRATTKPTAIEDASKKDATIKYPL